MRGVRFFVSDLFQKRPSWRGRAGAGPLCLSKKKGEKKEKKEKKRDFLDGFHENGAKECIV